MVFCIKYRKKLLFENEKVEFFLTSMHGDWEKILV
jgi:hypothetical protein